MCIRDSLVAVNTFSSEMVEIHLKGGKELLKPSCVKNQRQAPQEDGGAEHNRKKPFPCVLCLVCVSILLYDLSKLFD